MCKITKSCSALGCALCVYLIQSLVSYFNEWDAIKLVYKDLADQMGGSVSARFLFSQNEEWWRRWWWWLTYNRHLTTNLSTFWISLRPSRNMQINTQLWSSPKKVFECLTSFFIRLPTPLTRNIHWIIMQIASPVFISLPPFYPCSLTLNINHPSFFHEESFVFSIL